MTFIGLKYKITGEATCIHIHLLRFVYNLPPTWNIISTSKDDTIFPQKTGVTTYTYTPTDQEVVVHQTVLQCYTGGYLLPLVTKMNIQTPNSIGDWIKTIKYITKVTTFICMD